MHTRALITRSQHVFVRYTREHNERRKTSRFDLINLHAVNHFLCFPCAQSYYGLNSIRVGQLAYYFSLQLFRMD